MPNVLLTFFACLFCIPKSRLLNTGMSQLLEHNDEDTDNCTDPDSPDKAEDKDIDNFTSLGGTDDNVEDEDSSENEITWSIQNHHMQLHCLFQIIYYHMTNGRYD